MTEKKKTEAFLAAISYAGDVEADRIKEEGIRRAEERISAAREEARAEAEATAAREIKRAELREAARVSEAESALSAEVAKEREAAVTRILGRAENKLVWFTATPGYEEYMKNAAARTAKMTEGEEDRVILIREQDERLADALSEAAGGIPVRVSDSVAVGGLICDSRGMTCDLSFGSAIGSMRETVSREFEKAMRGEAEK